jgi:pseudaminic acid biosynthesis-associated methylase
MSTVQEDWWRREFGSQYVRRNRVDWARRVPFFQDVLEKTGAKSVLEVGANIGSNLKALRFIDKDLRLVGVEINQTALSEAADAGLEVYECSGSEVGRHFPHQFDLVATIGVLIHVSADHLSDMMDSIIGASRKYVLAVEYPAGQEEAITYRGHEDRLWRRPFGALYESKGLKLVEQWDAGSGFDSCMAWLMVKP